MGALELFSLAGKKALVTGASRGIGRALALGLAEAGADVVVTARTAAELEETAQEIRRRGRRSLALARDLREEETVRRTVEEAVRFLGGLDILVNSAGVDVRKPALELAGAEWDQVVDTNLKSVFLCCREAARHMQDRGGRIINIASMGSFVGLTYSSAYCAAKGGVAQLTRELAIEWARYRITVNAIAPGFFRTALTEKVFADPEAYRTIISRTPLGREGRVEDLVGTTVFLASEAAAYVTGVVLPVDGGFLAYGV